MLSKFNIFVFKRLKYQIQSQTHTNARKEICAIVNTHFPRTPFPNIASLYEIRNSQLGEHRNPYTYVNVNYTQADKKDCKNSPNIIRSAIILGEHNCSNKSQQYRTYSGSIFKLLWWIETTYIQVNCVDMVSIESERMCSCIFSLNCTWLAQPSHNSTERIIKWGGNWELCLCGRKRLRC